MPTQSSPLNQKLAGQKIPIRHKPFAFVAHKRFLLIANKYFPLVKVRGRDHNSQDQSLTQQVYRAHKFKSKLVNLPLLDLLQHGRGRRSLVGVRGGRRSLGEGQSGQQPPAPSSAASTPAGAGGAAPATSVRAAPSVVAAVERRWERRC